ncbi:MAG TPA: class I adenylate-forming enzyme family protein [Mycobacteriales bacterium]|jgi:acyl-CoA synthetase (AMP-forming)/AMP-acid ligase II|nr:class I adenylate-forming enzyme family protein [Mycobacteriales bacterium]
MRSGIPGVLDPALRDRPDATAVVARSARLSYAELDAQADRTAAALWELGLRPGGRVAASLPNDIDVVLAFHGAMRVGAIWVGIGEALAVPEKQHLIRDCAPALFLGPSQAIEDCAGALSDVGGRGATVEELRAATAAAGAAPAVDIDVHAPAGIAYTSGTTGVPKGIVHSQHNLLLPGAVLVESRGWGPALRKGDCLPLTILNLMVLTTLLTAQAQGCCVVMDRRDAEGIADWIEREQVTHWNGVPAQLHDLVTVKQVDPARLASLREVWSGGGDCPDALRTRFAEVYGLPIRSTYGLTEAPTVVSIDPVGGERRTGASGRVLPHLWVQTRGPDGVLLPKDAEGEICLSPRTESEWAGRWTPYLGVWRDGVVAEPPTVPVPTGDYGVVDSDGWLTVLDRIKVLIVRGGANVYPAEVERVLMAQEGVRGVAVFGIPDERLGERVAALVELNVDVEIDALAAACRTQLADYKVPERWGVVDSLPRNAMGKVVRTGLVDLLESSGGSTS